jgi:hypothetical protein
MRMRPSCSSTSASWARASSALAWLITSWARSARAIAARRRSRAGPARSPTCAFELQILLGQLGQHLAGFHQIARANQARSEKPSTGATSTRWIALDAGVAADPVLERHQQQHRQRHQRHASPSRRRPPAGDRSAAQPPQVIPQSLAPGPLAVAHEMQHRADQRHRMLPFHHHGRIGRTPWRNCSSTAPTSSC